MISKILNKFKVKSNLENLVLEKRIEIFKKQGITTILDVGANVGQYGESILNAMEVRMISFEPMIREFETLKKTTAKYKNWEVHNVALSNEFGLQNINISKNSFSSSFLELNPNTIDFDSEIGYKNIEQVTVETLDNMWDRLNLHCSGILLKIDTQGYESKVLKGASESLNKIKGLQIEMSIAELYHGEVLFEDLYTYIKLLGFELYILEEGYRDPHTGKLLQVDGIFFKRND